MLQKWIMILVTGASGTIGTRMVTQLRKQGHPVRCLVLPDDPQQSKLASLGSEIVQGDITDRKSLVEAFHSVDTVYHMAAVIVSHDPGIYARVNVQGTKNMLYLASRAKVQHFIYISSASVVYPRSTAYSRSKQECERLVRGSGVPWTIVRPTLVYERGGGMEFMLFWKYLRRFPLVLFVGDGNARKKPVHVDDLVQGLLAICGSPKSQGKIYNLCGSEAISIAQLAKLMLSLAGQPKPFVHIPARLCEWIAWVMSIVMKNPALTWAAIAGVTQHADLDCSQATLDLDYHPIGVRAGLERCFP